MPTSNVTRGAATDGFSKNHRQEPARESFLVAVRVRFDIGSQTKQLADLRGVPLRPRSAGPEARLNAGGVRIHVLPRRRERQSRGGW